MPDKLNATLQRHDGALSIKLAGIIDEDNQLAELADKLGVGRAVIDLGDIERINSCGTRDWVNWIAALEARGVQPVLVACSPAIVAQLNLVKNFSGGAVVKSFYVPYYCGTCDDEKVLLVDVADLGPPPHEPPSCRCDECESVMSFDDMPDAYFAFLSAKHRRSAQELDREVARGSSSSLRPRGRTSQSALVNRASAPLLPALRTPSSSRIEAVPSVALRPSRPGLSEAVPSPAPPLSRSLVVLIAALVAAILALVVLLAVP